NGCPAVTINSVSPSTLIIEGKSTTLTADASGGSGLVYQWYIGNPGVTTTPAGSGNAITVHPAVTTNYWVRVTNNWGGFADTVVIVTAARLCKSPVVAIPPGGGDVLTGTSASLFVGDTGTKPETYQWFEGAKGDTSNPASQGIFASFNPPPVLAATKF